MAFPYNYVVLSPDKKHFEINGSPWYFSGCNWYAFALNHSNSSSRTCWLTSVPEEVETAEFLCCKC